MFKNNVDTLISDVGKEQGSVADARTNLGMNNDRRNNIVIYNLKEYVTNSKSKDKELVSKLLKKFTNKKNG